jgi:hypothetical protein
MYKTMGWYGFLSVFPPFDAFIIVVSMGKRCFNIKIKCNKRKTNVTFKGDKRDNVNKAKSLPSPTTFSCCV